MKIQVRIAEIQDISPTVKAFVLDLQGQAFSFLAGQWIDCFVEIDGRTEVAGYSITSSPTEAGWFSIAVKLVGDNVVTDYMHEQARVGETLVVDGGQGDFYFDPATASGGNDNPIALIAGGIGITPIASIVRFMDKFAPDVPTTLLYSASAPAELLFRDEFEAIAARNPEFRKYFTVTRSAGELWEGNVGRIDADMLLGASVDGNTRCYICGPPEMIRDIANTLREIGVPDERIIYEQWW
ncbi:MAG: FAD-binding oxidoreductase [Chloroflexi bacterium]|nr:FAD-binding oxidoreductase [Chloroflexota bacterium]